MSVLQIATITTAIISVILLIPYQLNPFCMKHSLKVKFVCSSLFFLTGLFGFFSHGYSLYGLLMVIGLFCGIWGDFFLEYKPKTFITGVAFFSIGHLFYIASIGFIKTPFITEQWKIMLIGFIFTVLAAAAHIKIDKINFGSKSKFMYLYSLILIVSFLIAVTRGTLEIKNGNTASGICLILAGALFMLSDAFLGSQLFGKPRLPHTEYWVAFTYFPAQTLFALTVMFQ